MALLGHSGLFAGWLLLKLIAIVLLGCYGLVSRVHVIEAHCYGVARVFWVVSRVHVIEAHCYGVARVLWVGFQDDC